VADNGQRLGQILCDADIITKRQLAKAVQKQVQGDKRRLGEILIELGFVTIEDLTDAMLDTHHEEKTVKEKVVSQPRELSEEAVLNTKFTLSVQTMVAAGTGIASLVGMWYMLQADIQEAKELPSLESLYEAEYPSRPEGYNWPRSYEQYKDQVGSLQEDMDDVFDQLEEMEETIKELEKEIKSLERRKRDK
jgi:predicted RNase H-like nuclease (RuvC/YqgF family)|tara:strand:+ start:1218 stop:1793 length:576 start_codon:yes stop_codon:yes gene_type:complete